MPRVSEEHSESRRQQILHAALRCFARKGVHRTTVRDICTEAELSAGALYNYFPAKQQIIEAVFDASLAENARMFADLADVDDPIVALDRVRDIAFGAIDDPQSQEVAKAGMAIIAEAARDPRLAARYAAVQSDMASRLGQLIEAAKARGLLTTTADSQQVGRMMLAIHEGWRIQKLMDPTLDNQSFLETLAFALGARQD